MYYSSRRQIRLVIIIYVSVYVLHPNDMPVGIEAWVTQIPPITRGWLALSVLTSLAVVRPFSFFSVCTVH
jgi:hypothetical protein